MSECGPGNLNLQRQNGQSVGGEHFTNVLPTQPTIILPPTTIITFERLRVVKHELAHVVRVI